MKQNNLSTLCLSSRCLGLLTLWCCLIAQFSLSSANADVVRYTDQAGKTHYVDNPEKVPDEYKNQLETQKPLPKIGKIERGKGYDREGEGESSGEGKAEESVQGDAQDSDAGQQPTKASGKRNQKVEIFVTDWCPYCRQLENFLKKKQVRFTRYDIEKNAKGKKIYEEIGGTTIPVLRIGSKVLEGFDPEEIEAELGL